ncbi:MAG: HpcH/HpaI aldolase/citrate lyase family protein [Alphaproteobacteria bacterium]
MGGSLRLRSLLFVPADSERKLAKALASAADAIILDLEDSIVDTNKAKARQMAAELLRGQRPAEAPLVFVRVNSAQSGLMADDIAAIVPARPDGIVQPKCQSGDEARIISRQIATLERANGLEDGAISLLPIATETAASLFAMGTYAGATSRLVGLTWGAEDLSADLGASDVRDDHGDLTGPYALARSLTIFGACAAGVEPIDTIRQDFRDNEALARECAAAARDGFTGKLAIHPGQIAIINAAFTPTPEQIATAENVVAAFAQAPGLGVVALAGTMLDRPHLVRAQALLARATISGG